MDSQLTCTGQIIIPPNIGSFSNAVGYVSLEDVSIADVASKSLSSKVISKINHKYGNKTTIQFSLPVKRLKENHTYSIRALIDLDGNGEASKGDLITTTYNPVSKKTHSDIKIKVIPI